MVQDLPEKRVPEVCEKVWQLSQEPYHQFYPIFESEEDVKHTLSWTMERDGSRAYGYWRARVLEGVCCLFIEEEKHYVLIIALYSWGKFSAAANAFMRQIEKEFPGYTLEAGIAGEHTRFAQKLIRSGFRLQDDRFNMRHSLPAQIVQENRDDLELCVVKADALGEFAPLCESWFRGSLASPESLAYRPEDWLIVTARRADSIVGAVIIWFFAGAGEIDGFHAEDAAMSRALLLEAMRKSAQRADPIMTLGWMIQRSDPNLAVLYNLGFTQTAHYTFYLRDASE